MTRHKKPGLSSLYGMGTHKNTTPHILPPAMREAFNQEEG